MLQLRSAERGIADKWFLMMEGAALGLKERSLGALETLTAETFRAEPNRSRCAFIRLLSPNLIMQSRTHSIAEDIKLERLQYADGSTYCKVERKVPMCVEM